MKLAKLEVFKPLEFNSLVLEAFMVVQARVYESNDG